MAPLVPSEYRSDVWKVKLVGFLVLALVSWSVPAGHYGTAHAGVNNAGVQLSHYCMVHI